MQTVISILAVLVKITIAILSFAFEVLKAFLLWVAAFFQETKTAAPQTVEEAHVPDGLTQFLNKAQASVKEQILRSQERTEAARSAREQAIAMEALYEINQTEQNAA